MTSGPLYRVHMHPPRNGRELQFMIEVAIHNGEGYVRARSGAVTIRDLTGHGLERLEQEMPARIDRVTQEKHEKGSR